jgi:hypothetical protein
VSPGSARGHAALPKQPLRNRAIGFAGEVCIERTKDKHQSPASRRREVISGAINRLRSDGPPQASAASARAAKF